MEDEWTNTTLGEVITLQRGIDLPSYKRRPGNVPVVASTGIVGFHDKAAVKGPGVVIGRSGSIGGGQFIRDDFWPLNTTLWVKDFHGNDPRLCYYLLKSMDFSGLNAGSGVPTLNRNHLHLLPVRRPSLKLQRKISEILGSIDDKIECNRRTNQSLEAIAQTLFKSWFVDFRGVPRKDLQDSELGLIPKGWHVGKFSDNVDIIGGGTPQTDISEYWNGHIPWFSVVDTPRASDTFLISTEKSITQAGLKNSAARLVGKGTTIISARGTVGNLGIASGEMTFNQSCYGLRGKNDAGDYFVFLNAQRMVSQLQTMAHGSVFSTISRKTFESIHIPIPPSNIFHKFEEAVSPYFEKILFNARQSRTLAQLRDTLLPKFLSGELKIEGKKYNRNGGRYE